METRFRRGTRLMTAGAIVTTIGVALAVGASLNLPASWNTALVGMAIFAVGALRRAVGGGDGGACGLPRDRA